jgi:hypothetical protein
MNINHRAWVLVTLLLGSLCGCGPTKGDAKAFVQKMNSSNGKRLVNLYAQYQGEYGSGPKSDVIFKKYIAAKSPAALEEMGVAPESIDKLFISERDGQPFFIRYGIPYEGGLQQAVVFESQGQGGKVGVFFFGLKTVEVTAGEVAAYKDGSKDEKPSQK